MLRTLLRLLLLVLPMLRMLRPAPMLRLRPAIIRHAWLLVEGIARLEARNDALLDLAAHELLDIRHQGPVVETHQRNGFAG